MIYLFPHEDAVVLGGTVSRDDWDTTPRPETAERILRDCAAVEPRVLGAEALAHRVGLRPSRAEVRLEAEPLDGGGVLWHNYGHGGAGLAAAPAFAAGGRVYLACRSREKGEAAAARIRAETGRAHPVPACRLTVRPPGP